MTENDGADKAEGPSVQIPMGQPTPAQMEPIKSMAGVGGLQPGQEMSLEEAADRIEAGFKNPKLCPHCKGQIPSNVIATCRPDHIHDGIIITVSLAPILGRLSKVRTDIKVQTGVMVIRLNRGEI